MVQIPHRRTAAAGQQVVVGNAELNSLEGIERKTAYKGRVVFIYASLGFQPQLHTVLLGLFICTVLSKHIRKFANEEDS
jgi:hypothetical protein